MKLKICILSFCMMTACLCNNTTMSMESSDDNSQLKNLDTENENCFKSNIEQILVKNNLFNENDKKELKDINYNKFEDNLYINNIYNEVMKDKPDFNTIRNAFKNIPCINEICKALKNNSWCEEQKEQTELNEIMKNKTREKPLYSNQKKTVKAIVIVNNYEEILYK